jgi:hypothetical protein
MLPAGRMDAKHYDDKEVLERLSKICTFTIIFGFRKSQSFLAFSNRECERNYDNHSTDFITLSHTTLHCAGTMSNK